MRRVVVAGAGRPLGMSMVHAAVARGDRVIAGVRRPEAVPALHDLATDVGDRLAVVPFEAASEASCEALAQAAAERWGAVDLLVDAALAAGPDTRLAEAEARRTFAGADAAEIAGLLRINAVGPLLLARAFVPLLVRGTGPTVLVASPWSGSLSGKTQGGDYGQCASSAARNMVVRALGHDLEGQGIAVVLANPGNYKTELEGPAFQHRVEVAAEGLLAMAHAARPAEVTWRDWTGAERAW
ncbi:MAG: SDR family NAD(P)-dependent oxidoreductase [Gemmatimonadaceae bacterium]|jgi:NAD(P)-dependent dehydrogenase (short-subunit alcohol dehydrogenase family)|nr:SDR family NAD(P)-dependent oxidoreductase [Gemmatimonadaceae bacterium]